MSMQGKVDSRGSKTGYDCFSASAYPASALAPALSLLLQGGGKISNLVTRGALSTYIREQPKAPFLAAVRAQAFKNTQQENVDVLNIGFFPAYIQLLNEHGHCASYETTGAAEMRQVGTFNLLRRACFIYRVYPVLNAGYCRESRI